MGGCTSGMVTRSLGCPGGAGEEACPWHGGFRVPLATGEARLKVCETELTHVKRSCHIVLHKKQLQKPQPPSVSHMVVCIKLQHLCDLSRKICLHMSPHPMQPVSRATDADIFGPLLGIKTHQLSALACN